MEALIAGSTLNTAAPAPAAESAAPGLRAGLAGAIAARRAAEAAASTAIEVAERAAGARREADATVEQIRREIHAVQRDATGMHATACTEALRAGLPLPAAVALPATDSGALAAAVARMEAISQSAVQLADEAADARNESARAAAACREIVDNIICAEARDIGRQWVAAVRLGWELQDRLTGLARLGGELLPNDFQARLIEQVDRRSALIAENGSLHVERHFYDAHLNRLAERQEKLWLEYGRRLMDDADATFDVGLPQ